MRNIAKKAIPMACIVTAPFFVNADEQISEATAMLCATGTTTKSMPNAKPQQPACVRSTDGQITPPAGPLVCNGADVFITADFIWWKAQQDGLQYAYNGFNGSEEAAGSTDKGSMHQPHFKYEPGFKVGLGILCEHDNWDLFAQYTWLNVPKSGTKNSSKVNTLDQLTLVPNVLNTDTALTASADWGLHFNVLDVELGRNFWISKRLTVRPHVGMKFSWLEQHYNVSGTGLSATTDFFENESKVKQFGVGVRAGLDNAFYLSNKWSIFGDLAMTGLWNHFNSKTTNEYQATATSDVSTNMDTRFKPHTVTTVVELDLGLRFETIFGKGRYMWMMQAGWETQVWFNQGQFINVNGACSPGNLSLEGLTIKTGFYF